MIELLRIQSNLSHETVRKQLMNDVPETVNTRVAVDDQIHAVPNFSSNYKHAIAVYQFLLPMGSVKCKTGNFLLT